MRDAGPPAGLEVGQQRVEKGPSDCFPLVAHSQQVQQLPQQSMALCLGPKPCNPGCTLDPQYQISVVPVFLSVRIPEKQFQCCMNSLLAFFGVPLDIWRAIRTLTSAV